MQHRTGFRQRPIDATKQIQIVNNLKKVMESTDLESKKELNSIETELNKILELYDKKKIIIIPNVEKIDNRNNESNKEKLKKSNSKNSSLEKKELLMKNKSDIEYIQKEFKRPNHYIIYSEKQRQENLKRDYEATINDINFINFEKGFMKLEELEKVISTLENDIGDGEQIPSERVKNIIIDLYPKYENYVEKITKYFFTRRELFKKSLCRKFWKEQKTTDKYITTTFRRREREKMKMRKNKQNELESLDKIKEIKNLSNSFIYTILNSMNQREDLKKALIKINEFNFESKICILKNEKISKEIEDEWKKNEKKLNEIKKQLEEKEKKDEENLNINTRENSPKINNDNLNTQKNQIINPTNKDNCAPTEYTDSTHTNVYQGIVHDWKCRMMEGISGHAGVFTTANDIGNYMKMTLNNGYYNNNQFAYLATPKKAPNLYEPDTLLSPFGSNSKNELTNNNLLTNQKMFLNQLTPFKFCINNSPYSGKKYENKK